MLIAGVDPGEKTGMVLLELSDKLSCRAVVEALSIEDVLRYLDYWQPNVLVVEEFRLYPWMARSLGWNPMQPSQVIGAIKAWVAKCGYEIEYIEQPASVRKPAQTHTRKMEKSPMFRGKPHARDALRHAVWYTLHRWPRKVLEAGW